MVARIMDKHDVFTYEIHGIDQEKILSAYDDIVDEKYTSRYSFQEYSEYIQYMSQYCYYTSIDDVYTTIVLVIKVGENLNFDLIDLQFLVELSVKLKKNRKFESIILYFETDTSNYFRISQNLRLWYIFHAEKNAVWFKVKNPKNNTINLQRLAIKAGAYTNSKVLPLCQLSTEMWDVFSNDCIASKSECGFIDTFFELFSVLAENVELSQKEILKLIKNKYELEVNEAELYRLILSRYTLNKVEEKYRINRKAKCLTQFIYALYLANRNKQNSLDFMELKVIHETAESYAQGILQLIENALLHPIMDSEPYSFFSFRANNHPERLRLYIETPQLLDSLLEFSVSDISIIEEKAKCIASSFASKHPEFASITMDDFFTFTYKNEENVLKKYFTEPERAVNHFGLQIFSSTVTAHDGCFNVSSIDNTIDEEQGHYFALGEHLVYNDVRKRCFHGTTYSIILPIKVATNILAAEKSYVGDNSLEATVNALINDIGDYQIKENPVKIVNKRITLSKQEDEIQRSVSDLDLAYSFWCCPANYCINVSPKSINSIVVFCKAIFTHLLKNKTLRNIVLFFDDDESFLSAVRACCLFYDRIGRCNLLNSSKGLFLYNLSNKSEAYFTGESLSSVLSGLSNQYINGLLDQTTYDLIETIFRHQLREHQGFGNYIADIGIKLSVKNPNTNRYLIEEELSLVLNRDIHDDNIGCKIANTHFRLSKVHLDTYYEAQFLFGNSYWCKVFAIYLANKIDKEVNDYSKNIIIYGYEKYSSETLAIASTLLMKLGYKSVDILFYENGDPELDTDRVRFVESLKKREYEVCFFVGISSTLSTFSQMNRALDAAKKKGDIKAVFNKQLCTSVVQIVEEGPNFVNLITVSNDNTVSSTNVDFVSAKAASYLVSVPAQWFTPDECEHCLTGKYYKSPLNFDLERPLIEVDETSVIPTLLYGSNNRKLEFKKKATKFNYLDKLRNDEFVYAEHLQRKGNHYQYFLRLSHIYYKHKKDVRNWLTRLSKNVDFKVWLDSICVGESISIIISPQQNSSNGFVDDVNQIIFDGRAHTIVFDVRKEYRKTFMAKYGFMKEFMKGKNIHFFYVADHIIAGNTFHRTQSLISSLFKKTLPIFSGIFVLSNRHSEESERALLDWDGYLPFFSFIDLSIPSLRQHNCPACKRFAQYQNALRDSASPLVALEYQKKIVQERVKTLKEIHEIYNDKDFNKAKQYELNSDRLFIENKLWNYFFDTDAASINGLIDSVVDEFSVGVDNHSKVQKLCILIDVVISPMLIYQEEVKLISLKFVRAIFTETLQYINDRKEGEVLSRINISCADLDDSCVQMLFESAIWGLCRLGSTQFLSPDAIGECINVNIYKDIEKSKYEKRLISYIKFLLSTDRLKEFVFDADGVLTVNETHGSKSEILSTKILNMIGTKEWNKNPSFWRLLYIEAVSAGSQDKCDDKTSDRNGLKDKSLNDYFDNLPQKYREYLNKAFKDEFYKDMNVDIYISVKDSYCDLTDFSKIALEDICGKAINNEGYYFDEKNRQWYFSITNNLNEFKGQKKYHSILRELIAPTEVHAIIKISFADVDLQEQLKVVRRVLLHNNELLHMLEDDFDVDFFSRFYEREELMQNTRKTLGSHGKINWNEYQLVLHHLYNVFPDSEEKTELFTALMDIFGNAVISFANLVRMLRFNSQGKDVVLMINDVPEKLINALDVINYLVEYYRNEEGLIIDYKCEYECHNGKKFGFYMFGQDQDIGYFGPGVFAYIFLGNALKHADLSKPVKLTIKKNKRKKGEQESYDMIVSNTKKKDDCANSAVTIPAIKNMFAMIRNSEDKYGMEIRDDESTQDEYVIRLTNIIHEEVDDD